MNTRRTAAVLALTATAALLTLTACSTAPPEPTASPSATLTSTPTPTPTAGAIPTQEPVPAPTDQASAIAAANSAYEAYRAASLELLKDPSLGPEYMNGYVLPDTQASQLQVDTVSANLESGLRASGGPFEWQLNEAMSYAAHATDPAGIRNEVGSVQLFGCSDNTQVTFTNPDIPKGPAPFNATLVYVPAEQVWKVMYDHNFRPGEAGAPLC